MMSRRLGSFGVGAIGFESSRLIAPFVVFERPPPRPSPLVCRQLIKESPERNKTSKWRVQGAPDMSRARASR